MSGSTMLMSAVFFGVLIWGVWWLAWQTSKAHHELLQEYKEAREAEEEAERKKQAREVGIDKESRRRKTTERKKREVVFREVEEDEDDWEAPEPTGKHVYDPKSHKVVWVPNQ